MRVVGGVADSKVDAADALITSFSFDADATETSGVFLAITFRTAHAVPGAFTGSVGSLTDTGFDPSSLEIAISGVGGGGPNKIEGIGFTSGVAVNGTNADGYHTWARAGHLDGNTYTLGVSASESTTRADLMTWFTTPSNKTLTVTITDGGTATLQISQTGVRAATSVDFFEREDGRVYMKANPGTTVVTFTN